jgi:NAD(P)-dependent dehydrogenase (short-subunit alcohol dehydrogenase family)
MQKLEDEMRGKVVIITGGNNGIGSGCARAFCFYGSNVVIAARNEKKGTALAAELTEAGPGNCVFYKCDVSNADEVEALVEFTVQEFGQLDCIINNAGYLPKHSPIDGITEEDFEKVLRTNLIGVFSGCKYSLPYLRKSGGSIINMSSILGSVGQEGSSIYSATKGGIISLTKSLAIDEAKNGVRVNVVLPGDIGTDLGREHMKELIDKKKSEENPAYVQWISRQGNVMDTGWTCLFLASSMAAYMTGAEINVTGGFELGNGIKVSRYKK